MILIHVAASNTATDDVTN